MKENMMTESKLVFNVAPCINGSWSVINSNGIAVSNWSKEEALEEARWFNAQEEYSDD